MALSIEDAVLTWRLIEGGQILGRVFVQFNENVVLVGTPQWKLIDGQGNEHNCIWATPHIKEDDDIVDYVVANFRAQPAFGPYELAVTALDPAIQTMGHDKIPGGSYPITQ